MVGTAPYFGKDSWQTSVWEVGGLLISQRMPIMFTIGKVKQHFGFDLEYPDWQIGFWPIEMGIYSLGVLHGINVTLINESEIIQPS